MFAYFLALLLSNTLGRELRYPFGDFFALWSYARVAAEHPVGLLYDWVELHAAQVALGMEPPDAENPFPYPPTFLLLLRPLSALPYWPALIAWFAVTGGAFAAAATAGLRVPRILSFAVLLAPASSVAFVSGQGGFLVGALLVGGLRLAERRPVWGGALLGLLTYKPQFGILVPFALLAAGQWRCILSACATAGLFALAAAALFGWTAWSCWIESVPAYQQWFDGLTAGHRFMPTVQANAELLGFSLAAARGIQLMAACAMAAIVWRCFRTGPRDLAVPVLLAGTMLATPHAFAYDLPLLSGAVLLFVAHRLHAGELPDALETAAILLVLLLPGIMLLDGLQAPVSTPVLVLFVAAVLRRRMRDMGRDLDARLNTQALPG